MVAWTTTGQDSILSLLGKSIASAANRSHIRMKVVLVAMLRLTLTVAGLGFLCAGAWVIWLPLGLISIGASLLVLEWVVKR